MNHAALALLGSQCEVCRQWAARALCDDCIARHAGAVPRCERCGLRLGRPAPACGECLREPPPFARTVCAVDYDFPWDRLIADFKFHDRPELAAPLAERLLAALGATASPLPQLVLPVPLTPARLAMRGYNQAWELARRIAKALGLRAEAERLWRIADPAQETAPQAAFGRAERLRRLQGSFVADPRRRDSLTGMHVALVDDVMTTGATVREAAAALLRGGAATVEVWVVARTPAPAA